MNKILNWEVNPQGFGYIMISALITPTQEIIARNRDTLKLSATPPETKDFEIYGTLDRKYGAPGEPGLTKRFATLKELDWACQHSHFTFKIMRKEKIGNILNVRTAFYRTCIIIGALEFIQILMLSDIRGRL